MKKLHFIAFSVAVAVLFVVFQNCGLRAVDTNTKNQRSEQFTPLTYCTYMGGKVIQIDPTVNQGPTISNSEHWCEFGNTTMGTSHIDTTTLYNYMSAQPQIAVDKFLHWTTPIGPFTGNPASSNCANVGGTSVSVQTSGGTSSNCKFSDGSKIEEWTLYRGPSAAQPLMTVLQSH